MNDVVEGYVNLIDRFLDGVVSRQAFQTTFFSKFKREEWLPDIVFSALDDLFAHLDMCTDDAELISSRPDLYVDEHQLREKAAEVRSVLDDWLRR